MLELQGVTMRFGGLKALDEVSFRVEPDRIVGLIGPNGAGKTTVFNLISRFYRPSSGSIRFNEIELTYLSAHEIIGKGIARTFQNLGLFPYLTVMDNLLLGQHCRVRTPVLLQALRLPAARHEDRQMRVRARLIPRAY